MCSSDLTVLTSSSNVSASKLTTGTVPAARLPAGTVLQVVSATKTDTQLFASSSTFSDITGLSVTLTPTSASSKFLIFWSVAAGNGSDGSHFYTRLQRNGSNILVADAASNRTGASGGVINTSGPGQEHVNEIGRAHV